MCKDVLPLRVKSTKLDDAFVLSLRFGPEHPARTCRASTRFHIASWSSEMKWNDMNLKEKMHKE